MDQLKRLRTEKGLSQAKLAALADIDPSTVNQIERGAREASPATLRKLAQALDVSIAELLEDAAPKALSRSSVEPSFNDILEETERLVVKPSAATAQVTTTATAKPEEVRRILSLVWEREITVEEGTQQLLEAIA